MIRRYGRAVLPRARCGFCPLTMTGFSQRIVGRTDLRDLPEWRKHRDTDTRVEPWEQLRIPDSAELDQEEAGCAFRSDATFRFRDDRGLVFTVTREVSDRW